MRKLLLLLSVLAAVTTLAAQTGISGFVLNAENQKPIQFARVGAYPKGVMTHTNSLGYYFLALRPGRYAVGASADGFAHTTYPDTVEVIEGKVTEHIDFALLYNTAPYKPGVTGIVLERWGYDIH